MKKNKTIGLACAWLPVVFWMAAIFYFSSMPLPPTAGAGVEVNKLLHVAEYAGLGFLFARAIKRGKGSSPAALAAFSFAFALVYGASDEIHQLFVPGRHFAYADMLLDAVGGAVGGLANLLLSRTKSFGKIT